MQRLRNTTVRSAGVPELRAKVTDEARHCRAFLLERGNRVHTPNKPARVVRFVAACSLPDEIGAYLVRNQGLLIIDRAFWIGLSEDEQQALLVTEDAETLVEKPRGGRRAL